MSVFVPHGDYRFIANSDGLNRLLATLQRRKIEADECLEMLEQAKEAHDYDQIEWYKQKLTEANEMLNGMTFACECIGVKLSNDTYYYSIDNLDPVKDLFTVLRENWEG